VAAADYWDGDALRRHIALDVLNAVLIARGAGEAALEPVTEALQQGASLIVFPEGTRGTELMPAAFKSGLYHLAKAFPQVGLVPVWLDNLARAMPKGVFLPVPVSAVALFGAPLHLAAREDRTAFLTRARDAVVDLGRSLHPELADA
jgi:1-acyl-sn-glycerol-3-phosphate acyltransferase